MSHTICGCVVVIVIVVMVVSGVGDGATNLGGSHQQLRASLRGRTHSQRPRIQQVSSRCTPLHYNPLYPSLTRPVCIPPPLTPPYR